MAKFILRRFFLVLITMFLVSLAVFMIVESSPGNVAKNVLGAFITPEQEASFLAQQGLDKPLFQRYWFWLMGSDWVGERKTGFDLVQIETKKGFLEWWARGDDNTLMRWSLEGEDLILHTRPFKTPSESESEKSSSTVSSTSSKKSSGNSSVTSSSSTSANSSISTSASSSISTSSSSSISTSSSSASGTSSLNNSNTNSDNNTSNNSSGASSAKDSEIQIVTQKDNGRWQASEDGTSFFWGVDRSNHVVMWKKGAATEVWTFVAGSGWMKSSGGPQSYIPLKKGFLRGDFGESLRTGRPVGKSLFIRLRNSMVLAGIAFVIVMPLALLLGMIAGIKEGSFKDRFLSIAGMIFSVIPEFATGIFLILIMSHWLELVPGAAVFGEKAPWERPDMLVLPVLTLTLIELGYVLRITRASMAEVMRSPYIRTAFLKGIPFWNVILKHAAKNALIAPITVIMLHVNWLMGGIVIVEVVFGYPGLGQYLLDSALYKDVNAIEAGTMIMVLIAVGTQLLADILYTFLNPRIRYS
ncbi:Putative permease component of ABC transporter (modular protein) [Desulfamplus magnetovallimortis]|uniref:Putative permease component of ABC transporter (Modular protein) n=1 Tax=Desulfamplus magnetovallimortis TaxID=1246637 RepID=A0A1W1H6J6_9BACT|nr:ABC transporter permease [Desulfamplus magnetovallimortis]SLM28101.1 Putative permease component of ABC transporter (modular protein) [Desulfamplus magnetovallimortis]